MGQAGRWVAAVAVTVAAFTVTTWLCGALLLAVAIPDAATRWAVACGAGSAVAALAGMGGYGYATRQQQAPTSAPVTASGDRAVAVGGDSYASITTGDNTAAVSAPAAPSPTVATPPSHSLTSPAQSAPGATASGQRSAAVGGNSHAPITTGDTRQETTP